uniref:Sidoreflexin n=1 Tax=Hemiselmis tepida TaxID=464990 RepID=A0A7S0W4J4_9CRYP|mmetsp:Transcript_31596/g.80449  ORF Transcript_31596/g.80449 Transcript_31596/m.80449 type:complete len:330 (+) Transcript_31596:27-1016(+)
MAPTPPFSLDSDRYDQSTWLGRTKHFFAVTNPSYLLTSDSQIKADQDAMERFKAGRRAAGESDDALWEARTRLSAIIHPDTGKPIPPYFRVCAFVPANIPICAGLLMAPPTTMNIVFWQWVNQSYNAGFNFANRNASSPMSNTSIATAYTIATSLSISIGLGMNKAVQGAKNLSPGARAALLRFTPFAAVGMSNVANLLAMRSGELSSGIPVTDKSGKELGISKVAAQSAVLQGAVTRFILPAPVLVLPPIALSQVDRAFPSLLKANPRLRPAMELGIIVGCVWGALPVAIGLFPQQASIQASSLEKEFHGLTGDDGERLETLYFNKGV